MTEKTPTIWGVHAGRLGEADAVFRQGYVALGWREMGDLSRLPSNQEEMKQEVTARLPAAKPGSVPGLAGMLLRFVHVMKSGDLVINRSKIDRLIHIGEVTGPYQYDPAISSDHPHLRPVSWRKTVQPLDVTQGALYEMGSAITLFQVRNYADEWLALLSGKKLPGPVNPGGGNDDTIGIVASDIETLTTDFVLKRLSQELKGHPFAAFVAHLLETMGYRSRVSPEGADGGVDIVAHKDELGFEPPIVRVQVKSGSSNVSQPDVSALLGTLSQGEFGLVVALAGFTPPARTFARNKANLRLIDGTELVELILAHYEDFDPRYKGLLPLKRVYVPQPIESDQ